MTMQKERGEKAEIKGITITVTWCPEDMSLGVISTTEKRA
jgi:hypothetical protein